MSMLDVARYLSYSRSVEHSRDRERAFSLAMVNSGHLFSCLHAERKHWCFGRQQVQQEEFPIIGKGV